MKKFLHVIWAILLLSIVFYFVWINYARNKLQESYYKYYEKTNVFDKKEFDRLLTKNKYALLTVGMTDCSLCDFLLEYRKSNANHIHRYYIDIEGHNNNLIISQALHTHGFPTSYVIDRHYNIRGIIIGMKNFDTLLNDIINKINISATNNIVADSTQQMINYSLKGLMAYFDGDFDNMFKNAIASKNYGEYFFNNYLLYKHDIYDTHAATYKDAALTSTQGVDILIFESLIREIDPKSELLKLAELYRSYDVHDHKHIHDHNCNHEH